LGVNLYSSELDLLSSKLREGEVAFTFLGFSGVIVRISDNTFVFDVDNLIPPRIYDKLERIDFAFYTHYHADHFHLETAMKLYYDHTPVIIAEPRVYDELNAYIPSSTLIKAPARGRIRVRDVVIGILKGKHVCPTCIFALRKGNVRIFHGGDSGYVDLSKYKVEVAFVPTGHPSPTASPEDALKMVLDLRPKVVVAIHGRVEEMNQLKELVLSKEVGGEVIVPEQYSVYKVRVL